ncbi:DUF2834 domain-containing protein [Leptolyngbya ohadii]|uniref:DUF2834 domain-containing protein n=1 Tax=Leptolyngbya ohadii TaxID=1962290 RepID=UPI000B59E13C|nr:DUF2834 domain-containing protein [Leptolyngbya ohadii]
MMRSLYLVLCIVGTVLPYAYLVPFLMAHGLDLPLFFQQLFANHVSSLFGVDFIISSIVLWLFIFWEGNRLQMKHLWVYLASNLTVGISLALPLFLLMRQKKLEAMKPEAMKLEAISPSIP